MLAESAAAFGILIEDQPAEEHDDWWLWPENLPAWELWVAVQTQWRVGMAGQTGLDYAGVEAAMRMARVPLADRPDRFAELRVMERSALKTWDEMRKVQT